MNVLFTSALSLAPDVCPEHRFRHSVITGADEVSAALNTLVRILPAPKESVGTFHGEGATRVGYRTGSGEGLTTEMATSVTFNPEEEPAQTALLMHPPPMDGLFRDQARRRLNGNLNNSNSRAANVTS